MFVKAAITTVVAAMLAGGVVYYGMPGDVSGGSVNVEPLDASEPIKKKWIDKYLKTTPKTKTPVQTDTPSEPQDDPAEPQEELAATGQVDEGAGEPNPETDTNTDAIAIPDTELIADTEIEPATVSKDGEVKYFVFKDGVLDEIDALPERVVEVVVTSPGSDGPVHPTAQARLDVATQQAERIEQPELKDQAMMDIVEFALNNGLFQQAEKSVSSIHQKELRDTARSRIANTYALQGHADQAFRMIEQVEVDALRDVMRLQAIQALIAPERLPKPMQ